MVPIVIVIYVTFGYHSNGCALLLAKYRGQGRVVDPIKGESQEMSRAEGRFLRFWHSVYARLC